MTVFSFLCILFVAGSFFLEVDAFAPASRPRMMTSRNFLLKKVHEHESFITSLRNLNNDDDPDEYLFAQKGKITRDGEGDYFESEVRENHIISSIDDSYQIYTHLILSCLTFLLVFCTCIQFIFVHRCSLTEHQSKNVFQLPLDS